MKNRCSFYIQTPSYESIKIIFSCWRRVLTGWKIDESLQVIKSFRINRCRPPFYLFKNRALRHVKRNEFEAWKKKYDAFRTINKLEIWRFFLFVWKVKHWITCYKSEMSDIWHSREEFQHNKYPQTLPILHFGWQ